MTTPTVDYNRIHALASARKKVIQKFGSNLMHFWPMADGTPFIRDLLRKKVLVGALYKTRAERSAAGDEGA